MNPDQFRENPRALYYRCGPPRLDREAMMAASEYAPASEDLHESHLPASALPRSGWMQWIPPALPKDVAGGRDPERGDAAMIRWLAVCEAHQDAWRARKQGREEEAARADRMALIADKWSCAARVTAPWDHPWPRLVYIDTGRRIPAHLSADMQGEVLYYEARAQLRRTRVPR